MTTLWPWLALAGAGALHGLNPATGWLLVAARGRRSDGRAQLLRSLLPIALGHVVSVMMVAGVVALGAGLDRGQMQGAAGALLAGLAVAHWRRGACEGKRHRAAATGSAAMAVGSFMMSTAHGAGLMLVPAMAPICLSDSPAGQITASGSLLLALAALLVHGVSMLSVTALVAIGVRRGVAAGRRLRSRLESTATQRFTATPCGPAPDEDRRHQVPRVIHAAGRALFLFDGLGVPPQHDDRRAADRRRRHRLG